jgi:hypothetical protein
MRLSKRFATGGFTLILTTILLVDIVLGDIPKNPVSLLSVDRSKLWGGVEKVQIDIAFFNPGTGQMSKPMKFGPYEFTEDGEFKNPPYQCAFPSGERTEIRENGDTTIDSFYRSGILISETLHVFDSDGNVVESTPLYSNNGDYRKTVYLHEFDSRGNWTKRIWVKKGVGSSNQSSITLELVETRTITYY